MATSFFNFLKEGLLLPTRNRRLFFALYTVVAASTALLLLGSDLAIQPLADEIQLDAKALNSTDPGSPDFARLVHEIQDDTRELLLVGAGYLLLSVVVTSAVRIVLLFAAVSTYSGEEQPATFILGALLRKAKAQLKGPLLTGSITLVQRCESYELTTNPIRSPGEMESIERVSERGEEPNHNAVVVDLLKMDEGSVAVENEGSAAATENARSAATGE
ncbi:hypothetical protein TRIUR3_03462 [Triticum urartu]|uniref:Uncharacterized protein n=1 Tax=Triticum urartu TaxID=4572 RepID=M7YHG2_TRIUA|nr:hypothetical protein TRIUR3_03462 [Triticum urartu]